MIQLVLAAVFAATSAVTSAATPIDCVVGSHLTQETRYYTASTKIFTPENEQWFFELITLNPRAAIVVEGPGITVSNPINAPLVLPRTPPPADVILS